MKKYLTFLIPLIRLISVFLFVLTLSCNEKEPNPKDVCKLLSANEGSSVATYQYNEKAQLIRIVSLIRDEKFTYDDNGFLTESLNRSGVKVKYTYTDGLISKISYSSGDYYTYEYDSKKGLIAKTYFSTDGSKRTEKYLDGKTVAYLSQQPSGSIWQPWQFENGRIIRDNSFDGSSYWTYTFDKQGRLTLASYFTNGVKNRYWEYEYEEGNSNVDAEPTNFFKGFPKVIDKSGTKGVRTSEVTFIKKDNIFYKASEITYVNEFNSKRYLTASTVTGSSRSSPTASWVVGNPIRYTYAYINCGD